MIAVHIVEELRSKVFTGANWCTFLDLDYSRANLKVVDGVKKFFNGLLQDWLREMVAADHEQSCSCKLGPGYTQTMLQAVSRVQLTPSSYYVTKDRKVRHAIMDWWLRHPLTGAEGTTLWVDGAENRMQFNVDMVMSLIINYMFPWLAHRQTTKEDRIVIAWTHDGAKMPGTYVVIGGFKCIGPEFRKGRLATSGRATDLAASLIAQSASEMLPTHFWEGKDDDATIKANVRCVACGVWSERQREGERGRERQETRPVNVRAARATGEGGGAAEPREQR